MLFYQVDRALARWRQLPSDPEASYDREISIDLSLVEPMITYGTNPGMVIGVTEAVPDDGSSGSRAALEYMGLRPTLNLDMRLGEGTGAALAMHIIEAGACIIKEMLTFEEAGVSQA